MSTGATFEYFETELNRLVESFGKRLAELKQPGYAEAQLRDDFLNPFFRALGWDMENRAGLIQREREVEIESATQIGGGRKRADYLFRTDKRDRFVCEAKKPAEELSARYAFQAKRYAWNKGVFVALLTDFEELKIYIVGGKPYLDEPQVGEWKSWRFQQYPLIARELWDLLARDKVAAGSIDQAIEALPKKSKVTGSGKARQQWLIKPDRTRALDTDFLEFLDETRKELASDLYKNNDHAELLDGNKLTEACQRVIDRILFLRICEDRDIDTGTTLQAIVETWRKNTGDDDTGRRARQQPFDSLHEEPPANFGGSGIRAPRDSLWRAVVRHFRALDRRPPTHVPFFNGNLFKPHFTESLVLSDEWLAGFIGDLSDDESPYLFNVIDVEILGSVYERFLGNVVRPHGKGITVEPKPEVRKAGGVYYTPRYIVDYIVEQTAGKLLDEIAAEKETEGVKAFATRTEKLRLLDPACGSGSFLIRAFERVCEHWQKRLTANLREVLEVGSSRCDDRSAQRADPTNEQKAARAAWEKKHRPLCWVDAQTNDVHLTVALKRQILTQNIYGVDLDAAAVEVTQLSLYLKMLENENRTTLQRQRELLADETDIALLPPLQDNIKCGNSLIASDFSMMPEDLVRVHAFDWPVQFAPIMKAGGFDVVIGNPPYIRIQRVEHDESDYLFKTYKSPTSKIDLSLVFLEKSLSLAKKQGVAAFICTSQWLTTDYGRKLRTMLSDGRLHAITDFGSLPVFESASTYPAVFVLSPTPNTALRYKRIASVDALNLAGIAAATECEINLSSLSDEPWSLGSFSLPTAIKSSGVSAKPLSHFGGAYIGCKTGMNEVFVLSREDARAKRIEPGICFPYALRGEEVHRYETTEPGFVVIYPYHEGPDGELQLVAESEMQKRFPHALAHLLESKAALKKRQDSRRLYADGLQWYRHIRPGSFRYIRHSKLVFKAIAREMSGGLLRKDTAFDGANCPAILLETLDGHDSRYLLGLLNSKLLSEHLRAVCPPKLSGYVKFTANGLSATPIRIIDFTKPADKSRHDKLVVLVDKMLGLMPKLRAATTESEKATLQNAVTATDQQIDALVYELYGLTEDEIKLVEGNA